MPQLNRPYRLIVTGGGTGGHIYPAIAIANTFRARYPDAEILFVGALGRMEMTKVPEAGYKIIGLEIAGLQRSLTLKNLSFPLKVIKSVRAAKKIIKDFRPDAVVGVGGYASAPVLYAATLQHLPSLIQEQNSHAGLTNKLLGKRVDKVCVAYDSMYRYFPANKLVLTGNPVRKDIMAGEQIRPEAIVHFQLQSTKKTLLVIGGSLGARTLNESMAAGIAQLVQAGYQVIWQCGKLFFGRAKEIAATYPGYQVQVFEFISRMDLAYAAADVVISRAGALSISELCLTGKPAILVPSPNVAEDHQSKNAKALVEKNAAVLITDAEAREKLIPAVLKLISDPDQQQLLSRQIKQLARPEAAEQIVDELLSIMQ